jgi:putative spermidine/putrescine transport system permease protein
MRLSARQRFLLRLATIGVLAFIYVPLLIIGIEAFNEARTLKWPPPGFTTEWFQRAFEEAGPRDAFLYSLKTAAIATSIALVLGSLAALGVSRFRFFGREAVSFLVILPIALPGIVTGIALNSTFTEVLNVDLGLLTLVIAHSTFCIVVVYNNVIARLRRLSTSFEEASADLGATPWQTFRWVTLPNMRTALVAGALLAFGLSFDEIIVTVFTIGIGDETLPQWLLNNFSRPQQLPIVNAVAVLVVLISILPVYLAHRLSSEEVIEGRAAKQPGGGAAADAVAVP